MKWITMTFCLLAFNHSAKASIFDNVRRWTEAIHNVEVLNGQIGHLNSLVAQQRNTVEKELIPQLEAWNHTLSTHDAHYQTASQAQLAVNDAILYLRESIITNRALKTTFDRMTKKSKFVSNRPLSIQIREALPKMKLHTSTRRVLEQWVNSVARLEATSPHWSEVEKNLLPLVSDSRTSLSELLVEHLRVLNDQIAAELEQWKNDRAQDLGKRNGIESAIADGQTKISGYLTQISELQRQRDDWQRVVDRGLK